MRRFDAIVIGAGQAGPALALRLAAAGQTVAIVEREHFGGTCVNTGCTPTKTLIASARVAHLARRAAAYGVRIEGAVGFDLARAKARGETRPLRADHHEHGTCDQDDREDAHGRILPPLDSPAQNSCAIALHEAAAVAKMVGPAVHRVERSQS